MPRTHTRKKSGTAAKSTKLSTRTKKQIDSLPEHAQEIYKKAHANALDQYRKPEKRRGGKGQSAEQVAHKVAWAAVKDKDKYEKEGDRWIERET
jgi:cation transport regulator